MESWANMSYAVGRAGASKSRGFMGVLRKSFQYSRLSVLLESCTPSGGQGMTAQFEAREGETGIHLCYQFGPWSTEAITANMDMSFGWKSLVVFVWEWIRVRGLGQEWK